MAAFTLFHGGDRLDGPTANRIREDKRIADLYSENGAFIAELVSGFQRDENAGGIHTLFAPTLTALRKMLPAIDFCDCRKCCPDPEGDREFAESERNPVDPSEWRYFGEEDRR